MLIDKDDPRLSALTSIEDTTLIGASLRRFLLPGRGGSVDVLVTDGKLDLQPGRSSSHKALCSLLGIA